VEYLNQNRMNYIDLNTIINYWQGQKHEGDKGGNFNLELYFSASSGGGSPSFYVELYKYDGTTFTLLATDVATPEGITQGTVIDAYFTAIAVPPTTMALTDRLALRVFVTTSGRTLKLHTENSHLSQVITTLSTGVNAINGLTAQVQNFAVGTAGADFGISSVGSTHTFNLPTASAANRGALSSTDWSTFNGKQNNIGLTTVGTALATLPNPSAVRFVRINSDNTVTARTAAEMVSDLGLGTGSVSILGQFTNGDIVAASTTRFGALFNGSFNHAATDAVRRTPMVTAGTLTRLYVMTNTAQPATGSLVCTLRKNSVDQALTITIAAGSAAGVFTDLVNAVSVVAGDQMGMKFVNNATTSSAAILNNQVQLTI